MSCWLLLPICKIKLETIVSVINLQLYIVILLEWRQGKSCTLNGKVVILTKFSSEGELHPTVAEKDISGAGDFNSVKMNFFPFSCSQALAISFHGLSIRYYQTYLPIFNHAAVWGTINWFKWSQEEAHSMTLLYGNAFRITGPLWGESTWRRWIPCTKNQWCRVWIFFGGEKDVVIQQSSCRWFETPWQLAPL